MAYPKGPDGPRPPEMLTASVMAGSELLDGLGQLGPCPGRSWWLDWTYIDIQRTMLCPAPGCRGLCSFLGSGTRWPAALADVIPLTWAICSPAWKAARKRVTWYRLPAPASVWEEV